MEPIFGRDLFGNPREQRRDGVLSQRFIVPPFSVLDARGGAWQERKRAWLALGIQSEIGRGAKDSAGNQQHGGSDRRAADRRSNLTGAPKKPEWATGTGTENMAPGTSIFDPVLCELAYEWFCPKGGQVIDPFAGGSVRGIIASALGRPYWGCDLSSKQIEANRVQAADLLDDDDPQPEWVCGDSIDTLANAPTADFIFSCPPYGDLERYSDNPRDISTMEYHTFLAAYSRIILRSVAKLKRNRLACFVVGDFRDKKTGNYRGFVADTIRIFREMEMELYNDAVLVTAVGSLPIRVSSQFKKNRKLGKTHQNVLVFRK